MAAYVRARHIANNIALGGTTMRGSEASFVGSSESIIQSQITTRETERKAVAALLANETDEEERIRYQEHLHRLEEQIEGLQSDLRNLQEEQED